MTTGHFVEISLNALDEKVEILTEDHDPTPTAGC
jgi:hypothetical protein